MLKLPCSSLPLPNSIGALKRYIALTGLFLACVPCVLGQNVKYIVDAERSGISFKISHMGFLTVHGEFHRFSGAIVYRDSTLVDIRSRIVVASLDTQDQARDKSLVDEAYLDASTYPYIRFHALDVTRDNPPVLTGMLQIKGISKEISMPVRIDRDQEELSLALRTQISRASFGLDFGTMDMLVGDVIDVEVILIAIQDP
ncbi:YceI family protein [Flavobacteriaceae bacterium 3-367]